MNPEVNMPQTLPPSLVAKIEEEAHAQGKTPAQWLEAALERSRQDRSWQELLGYGERQAQAQGIGEGDVERLIEESRSEQRGR
jgi:hypothetical protein